MKTTIPPHKFAVGVVFSMSFLVGCAAVPPQFKNHVCPPQPVPTPSVTYASGMQVVSPQQQFPNQMVQGMPGAQMMQNGMPAPMQPVPAQPFAGQSTGSGYLQDGSTMMEQETFTQQDPTTVDALVKVVEKLETAHQQNATLQANLTKLQNEKKQYAARATELAERVKQDNVRLGAEVSSWRSELKEIETIVQQQKQLQQQSLGDIEGQLDTLLTEYETDIYSNSSRDR